MNEEPYETEDWCPFCEKKTTQTEESAGHERDTAYDSRECLECGATSLGISGFKEWYKGGEHKCSNGSQDHPRSN